MRRYGRRVREGGRSQLAGAVAVEPRSGIEYTSLRDMMLEGSGGGGGGGENHGGGGCAFRAGSWRECNNDNIHEFDASNIGIRNQLLKHAASAYLQSAVVVGGSGGGARGRGCCLVRLWHRISGGHGRGQLAQACSWQGASMTLRRSVPPSSPNLPIASPPSLRAYGPSLASYSIGNHP
ncbi:hypothetical protein ZWY2020_014071 [Hordeum vulgare]|nr:hypothetical protein ZWY2020_014071 [Hordeum vulgare]